MLPTYSVAMVLDTEFADRLLALASRMPVWIVDTPANRSAAQRFWDSNQSRTDLDGVTTFKVDPAQTPETWLSNVLGDVDLHHGQYSHNPPYSAVEVFGATLTPEVREAFAEFGLIDFVQRPGGFVAARRS